MRIKVRESRGSRHQGWGRWLRRRAGRLLLLLGVPEAELSLLVAGDRLMRRLNRIWRGRARTTDVLAFPQQHGRRRRSVSGGPRVAAGGPPAGAQRKRAPPGGGGVKQRPTPGIEPTTPGRLQGRHILPGPLLGDVVVCLPQAGRQARALGHPLEEELAVLLVHGVLHLLGYEHEGVGETRAGRMWREQDRLVRLLGDE